MYTNQLFFDQNALMRLERVGAVAYRTASGQPQADLWGVCSSSWRSATGYGRWVWPPNVQMAFASDIWRPDTAFSRRVDRRVQTLDISLSSQSARAGVGMSLLIVSCVSSLPGRGGLEIHMKYPPGSMLSVLVMCGKLHPQDFCVFPPRTVQHTHRTPPPIDTAWGAGQNEGGGAAHPRRGGGPLS